jgi:hypothetical protein
VSHDPEADNDPDADNDRDTDTDIGGDTDEDDTDIGGGGDHDRDPGSTGGPAGGDSRELVRGASMAARDGPAGRVANAWRRRRARICPGTVTRGPPRRRSPCAAGSFRPSRACRNPISVAIPPAIMASPAAVIQFVTGVVTNRAFSTKR